MRPVKPAWRVVALPLELAEAAPPVVWEGVVAGEEAPEALEGLGAGAVWEPLGALADPLADPLAAGADPEAPPVLLGRAGVEVRVTPTVAQSC